MAIKLYEYIDKAIYNYASCYDAPDTSENEEFSDALVDVIDLISCLLYTSDAADE